MLFIDLGKLVMLDYMVIDTLFSIHNWALTLDGEIAHKLRDQNESDTKRCSFINYDSGEMQ